jgi:hypothetical protein
VTKVKPNVYLPGKLCRFGAPVLKELADALESDADFPSTLSLAEQYFHACRILRNEQQVPRHIRSLGLVAGRQKDNPQ